MPKKVSWIVSLFVLILVGACSTPQKIDQTQISPATPEPELPLPPKETPEVLPQAPQPPDGKRLIGLTPAEVQTLLGAPDLVRRDGPVQIVLYRPGPCVLDLYFYSEAVGSGFTLRSIQSRDISGLDAPLNDCIASVLGQRPVPEQLKPLEIALLGLT